jgi:hypothetical protein
MQGVQAARFFEVLFDLRELLLHPEARIGRERRQRRYVRPRGALLGFCTSPVALPLVPSGDERGDVTRRRSQPSERTGLLRDRATEPMDRGAEIVDERQPLLRLLLESIPARGVARCPLRVALRENVLPARDDESIQRVARGAGRVGRGHEECRIVPHVENMRSPPGPRRLLGQA